MWMLPVVKFHLQPNDRQPAERHIPFVITFIEPVNFWSHVVSCNGPLCTSFQSHTLYRFFVSVLQENNSRRRAAF